MYNTYKIYALVLYIYVCIYNIFKSFIYNIFSNVSFSSSMA